MLLCRKVRIDPQGRVQIPKEMLNEANLEEGDTLYILVSEETGDLQITKGDKCVS